MVKIYLYVKYVFYILVAISVMLALTLVYLLLSGSANIPEPTSPVGLAAIFIVGLFTGFHCIGMCGAFCAASANDKKGLALYLSTKTFSYTLTGILLGALGGVVVIGTQERTLLSLLAGGFMILYALNVLGMDLARKIYGSLPRIPVCGENGGPVAAGLLNGVMPCGPLQAMQVYALSTASALQGGLVMLTFALGTLPLMAGFG